MMAELQMLEAALAYAARDWPVFPCRRDKHPYTDHGFKDASCDATTIEAWWRRWPQASIGIATGAAGLVVIDIDIKNGAPGEESWATLLAELGSEAEETAIAQTPSGGRHLYYRVGEYEVASSAGRLAFGIDVRGRGGYVIAPPSRSAAYGAYRWLPGRESERLAVLPPALAERLAAPRQDATSVERGQGGIARGARNSTLARLAGALRARGLSEEAIAAALLAENRERCRPSLPEDEVRDVAASIARYPISQVGGGVRTSGSDLDNAERFIAMFGRRVRYCASEKRWYLYDDRRWAPDERLAVEDLMRRTLLSVFTEAAQEPSDAAAKAAGRIALHLQSANARRAALEYARSDPRIAVHPSEFDRHPNLLNCTNGTLDLRTRMLRPHDPADLIRQLAPVAFDPEARLPLWERFLDEVTGGDLDLREYLQRAAGYSLTGETGERVFFLLLGPTTTGKSTFVEALLATLGDYARQTGVETFLRRAQVGGPRPEIAALVGRRLVTGIEVDEERRLDEVLIKQIVGGDTVSERDLYAGARPFVPECKLWFAANAAPRMNDADDALWTRVRLIPFTRQIAEERRDPSVKAILRDPERAGAAILAWALAGCLAWRKQGLGAAPAVQQATGELRLSMDPLSDFLAERGSFEPRAFTSNPELRGAYQHWLAAYGVKDHIGPREWGERLKRRGLIAAKERDQRGYRGIRLLDAQSADARTEGTEGQ